MDISQIVGYVLAVFVGISLGLVGSGGSILSVPILVYVMAVNPVFATGYSLFIVGSTALVGGIKKAINKEVNFKTVLIFGFPSVIAVFAARSFLVPGIPDTIFTINGFSLTKPIALMLLFALVMILAAIEMMKSKDIQENDNSLSFHFNYSRILLQGIFIGILSGTVGAGGGFLIIPALVLLARMPMKMAIGTSLFIVAMQSLIGFTGDLFSNQAIDWKLLLSFTSASVVGIFIGNYFSKKISGEKLKTGFGWMVLLMGIYIVIKELFLQD